MWKIAEKVFHFILSEFVIFGIPLLYVSQALAINFIALCLIAELIVKKLVKEHLRYNFIFAACASQSVSPVVLFRESIRAMVASDILMLLIIVFNMRSYVVVNILL